MVFILLPAYNESDSILLLFQSILSTMQDKEYCVVLVDDGSTDNTSDIALSYPEINLKLIKHSVNKGLGEALKTGLVNVIPILGDNDIVVTMDTDNTHSPELIIMMQDKLDKGSDIVIASRYEKGGREIGLSFFRHMLSKIANTLFKFIFNLKGVRDYTCGYRAYKASLLKKAFSIWGDNLIQEKGFTCMLELLVKLSQYSSNISEVPLVLRYDFKKGKSKIKIIKTICNYFLFIFFKKAKIYER